MQVDLSSNFFELFALPVRFAIDDAALTHRFRELQKQLHPDRYAAAPAAERRWSMQAASHVNEGFQTLKSELRRATYLLSLHGISLDEETDTQMSPMFLMAQMEYREALEQAESASDPLPEIDALRRQVRQAIAEQVGEFERAAGESDWVQARTTVRQWQFLDKLTRELKSLEERLEA